MKLDRIHEIACVCSAIMVCLPFFVDWVIADIPDWGWQFTTSALYTLINDRILGGKPTIISTNLTIEEFERRYNRQIASRLRGSYTRIPFLGEDIRVLKNR